MIAGGQRGASSFGAAPPLFALDPFTADLLTLMAVLVVILVGLLIALILALRR